MRALTFEAVRTIGLALPNTEEGTAWGTPVLRVNGTIFAGIPIHKSAEPHSVMFRVDFADRKTSGNDYYPNPIVRRELDRSSGFVFVGKAS